MCFRVLIIFMISAIIACPGLSQFENRQAVEVSAYPLSTLHYKPSYRIGVNYLYKRWTFGIDAGYGNYHINKYRAKYTYWTEDYTHWTLRPHIFYTYSQDDEFIPRIFSAGLEFFVKQSNDQFEDNYYEDLISGERIMFDRAYYQDRLTGIHLVNQGRLVISNRFYLDALFGIGFAYRNIEYSSVHNPRPRGMMYYDHHLFGNWKYKRGGRWIGRFRLGLDITYRIWGKN